MAYIAGQLLKIDGKWRDYGAPVPEADTWTDVRPWVEGHFIVPVPDDRIDLIAQVVTEHGFTIEDAAVLSADDLKAMLPQAPVAEPKVEPKPEDAAVKPRAKKAAASKETAK